MMERRKLGWEGGRYAESRVRYAKSRGKYDESRSVESRDDPVNDTKTLERKAR